MDESKEAWVGVQGHPLPKIFDLSELKGRGSENGWWMAGYLMRIVDGGEWWWQMMIDGGRWC